MAGLNAANAESINAVFVLGKTTSTGLVVVLLVEEMVEVEEDLLQAIKIQIENSELAVTTLHLDLKI